MIEKRYLEQLNQQLSEKLGQAIWAFAKIEHLTYEYLRALGGEEALALAGHQNFVLRLNAVRKLIELKQLNRDTAEEIISLLGRAEALVKKRNAIAHNPWQIFIDMEKMDFVAEIIKYMNQEERLNSADLETFTKEASELGKAFDALLQKISWANC